MRCSFLSFPQFTVAHSTIYSCTFYILQFFIRQIYSCAFHNLQLLIPLTACSTHNSIGLLFSISRSAKTSCITEIIPLLIVTSFLRLRLVSFLHTQSSEFMCGAIHSLLLIPQPLTHSTASNSFHSL